jgi:hypothetical protein
MRSLSPMLPLLVVSLSLVCGAQSSPVIPAPASIAIFTALHVPATSRPPAKLFLGTRTFDVAMLEPEHMAGLDGVTFCDKNLIIINVATTEITMRKAFMHEALHAAFCSDGYKPHWWTRNQTRRHEDIYYLGPVLATIMADNPYLAHWLDQDAK